MNAPYRRLTGASSLAGWAAATTVVTWASAFVVIRQIGRTFSPGPLTLIRIGVAALALSAMMIARREALPARAGALGILFCGVAWFGLYNLALNEAERRVDAGTAAMVVYFGPVLIAVLAGVFLGEGFPRRLLGGVAISFTGVVLIGTANSGASGDPVGVSLCIAAAVLYAIGVISQKPALAHSSSLAVTWAASLAGLLVCLPFAPQLVDELGKSSWHAILWGIYLGVVPTALAFTTWAYALSRSTAGRMGGVTYLVPALAVLMGWVFLAETPAVLGLVGGAIVIAGVIIGRRSG
jgi:drug/metabolite transporter (DMT)-like permease